MSDDVYTISNEIEEEAINLNKLVCRYGWSYHPLTDELNRCLSLIKYIKSSIESKNESLKRL